MVLTKYRDDDDDDDGDDYDDDDGDDDGDDGGRGQVEKCTRYNSAEPWSELLVDCSADSQSVPEVALHVLDQHQVTSMAYAPLVARFLCACLGLFRRESFGAVRLHLSIQRCKSARALARDLFLQTDTVFTGVLRAG